MTASIPAWLLFVGEQSFALAEKEMIEYIIEPDCVSIPVTPAYSSKVIQWREQIIPVMDLGFLENGLMEREFAKGIQQDKAPSEKISSLVVVAYQLQPLEPLNYLALVISKPPVRILVGDEQGCEPPEDNHPLLKFVTMACFSQGDEPIPILDLKRLSSTEFLNKVMQASSEHLKKTA